MYTNNPAKRLTVHIGETERFHGRPAYEVILDIFSRHGLCGISVYRGVAGYDKTGGYHTEKMLDLSTSLPVRIEAIDSEEAIERALLDVYAVVKDGLIEVSDTNVLMSQPMRREPIETPPVRVEAKAKMLQVFINEDDKWEGEPLYEAIIERLAVLDIAGVTVYRAAEGYGSHKRVHKKRAISLHNEMPMMLTIIESDDTIKKVVGMLDGMLKDGLVTIADVDSIRYSSKQVSGINPPV